jgi:hypothetical protein
VSVGLLVFLVFFRWLLHLLLRVACVVGVSMREGQVVCCGLGVEKENVPRFMNVCVCVCVDVYGWRDEKWH